MAIRDIIKKDVTVIQASTSIKDASKLMKKNHVGAIVVVGKSNGTLKKPLGILTDRDIALSIGLNNKFDPKDSVDKVMTKNVLMCSPGDSVYETIQKMQLNGVRRLPVVDKKNNLVGIIAADDLIQLLGAEINDLSQIITTESEKEKGKKPATNLAKQVKSRISKKTSYV